MIRHKKLSNGHNKNKRGNEMTEETPYAYEAKKYAAIENLSPEGIFVRSIEDPSNMYFIPSDELSKYAVESKESDVEGQAGYMRCGGCNGTGIGRSSNRKSCVCNGSGNMPRYW